MENVERMNKGANARTYLTLDLFQIAFGVFLFLKGISLLTNAYYVQDLLSTIDHHGRGMFLMHILLKHI